MVFAKCVDGGRATSVTSSQLLEITIALTRLAPDRRIIGLKGTAHASESCRISPRKDGSAGARAPVEADKRGRASSGNRARRLREEPTGFLARKHAPRGREAMTVRLPSIEQLKEISHTFGLALDDNDLASFRELMRGPIASCARLDRLVEPKLPVKYPRDPGYRPAAEENRYNAWYWRTEIKGAPSGLLAGKAVAIKDNICVAGVPMMNGSQLLEGYVPEIDATVVTRILDAGGTIAGKAACEDLCFSGASPTCATGPILNPQSPKHSAGGSSGGSASVVAARDVPMALGGDQGGSIRTPSSWCGVYGLKPTWGLVPTTGSMPISYSVDHCGPMCASTE